MNHNGISLKLQQTERYSFLIGSAFLTYSQLANAAAKEFVEAYDPHYDQWNQQKNAIKMEEIPILDSDTTKHVIILLNRYVLGMVVCVREKSLQWSDT